MKLPNPPKPKPQPLGKPLGMPICAHNGGNAWRLLLKIQELNCRRVWEIGTLVLEKHEAPPFGSVYLRDVKATPGATKFSSRPIIENGRTIIDIPAINAVTKQKRMSVNAGMILATVALGSNWRDRSGCVHNTTLCAPAQ